MANKRNYEWALASVIDGFFTQDKSGGVTQRVPFSLIVSSLQGAGVFQPLGNDLTAIEAISGTGVLTRTGTNTWAVVSAVAPTDHAAEHHYGGGDQITGQNLLGLRVTDSPEFNRTTLGSELRLKRSGVQEWGLVAGSSGLELAARNSDWSAIDWPITIGHDAGGTIRLGGTTNRPVNLTYTLQMGGIDTITSTREGRFTGMRLSNMSSGQIPVASDGNGQITASGQTDDGTYFTSNRIFRLWNTMAISGGTWTDLQWTPDAQERISMVSSNGSGVGAYHTFVVVPADGEATGRELGYYSWGQKLSGKSGSYPGLKASLGVTTKGAGGSTGGFGAQFHFDYRPDNGSILSTALRIGAFGGSTADAVEAAILLRANAGILATSVSSESVTAETITTDSIDTDSIEFTSSSGIIGNTGSNLPAPGSVGEYIEAFVGPGDEVDAVNNTEVGVCYIDLPAGDWDLSAELTVHITAVMAVSEVLARLADTVSLTARFTGNEVYGGPQVSVSTNGTQTLCFPPRKWQSSLAKRWYLIGVVAFSSGTPGFWGRISARRVR